MQSVDRAFAVLRWLQAADGPMPVQEVAQHVGLDRTVVHRLLKTLAQHGMAVEDRGGFTLGPEPVAYANRYVDSLLVRRVALPLIVELHDREFVDAPWALVLSIPVGAVSAVIERVWTRTTPLDVVLNAAEALPLDQTATGRSILAYYEPDRVADLLGTKRARAVRPSLIAAREAGGVAVSRGEAVPGLEAVAAVVLSRRGTPVAALGIVGASLGAELAHDSPSASTLRRVTHAIGAMIP